MENNKPLEPLLSKEQLEVINQIREIYNFITTKQFCKLIPEVRTNIAGALKETYRENPRKRRRKTETIDAFLERNRIDNLKEIDLMT